MPDNGPSVELRIPEATVNLGLAFGLMERSGEDVILTPTGSTWLRDYCERRIAGHEAASGSTEPPDPAQ